MIGWCGICGYKARETWVFTTYLKILSRAQFVRGCKNNQKITLFFQWMLSIPNHHPVQAIHGSLSSCISLNSSISVLISNASICNTVLSNNKSKPTKSTIPPICFNDSNNKSNESANQDPHLDLLDTEQSIYNDINEINFSPTLFLDLMGDAEITESNTELVLETVNKL